MYKKIRLSKDIFEKFLKDNPNYTYAGGYGTAQQGKEITNAEALTGQFLVDEGAGNINLEGNEFVKRAMTGDVQKVVGEPHLKGGKIADGVNVKLDEGDKVLSNYLKVPAKDLKELKKRYDLSVKKGATFADLQKQFDRKIKKTKETEELADLLKRVENVEKNLKDETTKGLNIEALQEEKTQLKNELQETKAVVEYNSADKSTPFSIEPISDTTN